MLSVTRASCDFTPQTRVTTSCFLLSSPRVTPGVGPDSLAAGALGLPLSKSSDLILATKIEANHQHCFLSKAQYSERPFRGTLTPSPPLIMRCSSQPVPHP